MRNCSSCRRRGTGELRLTRTGLLLFAECEGSYDGDDDGDGGEDKFESFHAKKNTEIRRSDGTVKKKSPHGALVNFIVCVAVFFCGVCL